jgi:putative colanic acid biosynthesis UDP-glucose lipid carrier transferase
MVTSELPVVTLAKNLLNPTTIVVSFAVCTFAYGESFNSDYLVLAILVFLISAQVFDDIDIFRSWRDVFPATAGRKVLFDWLIVVAVLLFLGFATKLSGHFSRKVLITWFIVTPFVLVAAHSIARLLLQFTLVRGMKLRSMVIVGANTLGLRLAKRILDDRYMGIEMKGFFDDRHPARLDNANAGPLLGRIDDLPRWVRQHSVNMIYVTLPMVAQPRIVKLLDELGDTTASIYFVPDIFVFDLIQARLDSLSGIPVVAVCETPFAGFDSILKRLTDVVFAGLILLLIWPLMLAIAVGIKLGSPGPVLFTQRRYGLDGADINIFKFRTMNVLEDGGSVTQAKRSDSRITSLGAFLRRTSLDELPQFLNVLQGTMSIVGPRPHAVAHNEQYRKLIKRYMIRHKIKPGITGWAQVNGYRGETETVEKMQARVEHDLDYMRNWSVSLDLWIMLKTIMVMVDGRNAY